MARGQQQETHTVSGVVEAKSRAGTGLKIGEDWFNAFHAKELEDVQAGDEVEFDYSVTNKGGKDFKNILEGTLSVIAEGSGPPPARNSSRGGARQAAPSRRNAAPARQSSGRADSAPRGQSAEPDRQRSIVRQNSLSQANALFASLVRLGVMGEEESHVAVVLEMARMFEKYSMLEDGE